MLLGMLMLTADSEQYSNSSILDNDNDDKLLRDYYERMRQTQMNIISLRDYHERMRQTHMNMASNISEESAALQRNPHWSSLPLYLLPDEDDDELLRKEKAKEDAKTNGNAQHNLILDNPNWLLDVGFRFNDLPAELRVQIYSCLLPHNLIITFSRCHFWTNICANKKCDRWITYGESKTGDHPVFETIAEAKWCAHSQARCTDPPVQKQLFLVSKAISNEAQGKSNCLGVSLY